MRYGWIRAPLGAAAALALLMGMVALGMRQPLLGWLFRTGDVGGLDYSAPPVGGFAPLRGAFVDSVLGDSVLGRQPTAGSAIREQRSGGRPGTDAGAPELVTHPLTNDRISQAHQVGRVPFTAQTNSGGATRESGEPSDCSGVADTIWYRYMPKADIGLIANTFGSAEATSLGVYRGRPGSLAAVGCDQDLRGNALVEFPAKSDVTYFFQIGFPAGEGPTTFRLQPQGTTVLLSHTYRDPREPGNRQSDDASISADGRFAAFGTYASDVHPDGDDTPCMVRGAAADPRHLLWEVVQTDHAAPCHHVYVRDLETGAMEIISKTPKTGAHGNSFSGYSMISGNGRYVVFLSLASNLVPEDRDAVSDIYVYDRLKDAMEWISRPCPGCDPNAPAGPLLGALLSSISYDGRYIVFGSWQSNLVPNDTNAAPDVFVHDRLRGTTERVSVPSRRPGEAPREGQPQRPPAPPEPADPSASTTEEYQARWEDYLLTSWDRPSISPDGRYVVFETGLRGLTPEDTNDYADVFLRDRRTHTTELISVADDGGAANGSSGARIAPASSVTPDGRYVVFDSYATNILEPKANGDPGDGNDYSDVFIRDRRLGKTTRISMALDGSEADGRSVDATISSSGRYVVFTSSARNLVHRDDNPFADVFMFDRHTETVIRVSVTTAGEAALDDGPASGGVLSADGRRMTFWTHFHSGMSGSGYVAGPGKLSQSFVHTFGQPLEGV